MILKILYKWTASILAGSFVFIVNIPDASAQKVDQSDTSQDIASEETLAKSNRLFDLITKLLAEGRFEEAHPHAEKSVQIDLEYFGATNTEYAASLSNLAVINHNLGNLTKAEKLWKDIILIYEKNESADEEKGTLHLLTALDNLARIYKEQSDYAAAEQLYLRHLKNREAEYGRDHPQTATALNLLSGVYLENDEPQKSLPLLIRALAISERNIDEDKNALLKGLGFLGELAGNFINRHDYKNAEQAYLLQIEIVNRVFSPDKADRWATGLGRTYWLQGKLEKAESIYTKNLEAAERLYGVDDKKTSYARFELTNFLDETGNNVKLENNLLEDLASKERLYGENHIRLNSALLSLAEYYDKVGDYAKAQNFHESILETFLKEVDGDDWLKSEYIANVGINYKKQNSYEEAERFLLQALEMNNRLEVERGTGLLMNEIADLYKQQERFSEAYTHYEALVKRFESRVLMDIGNSTLSTKNSEGAFKNSFLTFYNHSLVSFSLALEQNDRNEVLFADAFRSAQYGLRTSAGSALAQASVRFAAEGHETGKIVEQIQSASLEWSELEQLIFESMRLPQTKINDEKSDGYYVRQHQLKSKLTQLDKRLETDFPEYFTLTSPKPLSVEEAQNLMYGNEALVIFLSGDEGTLVFAITKDKIKWTRVDVDTSSLEEAVRVLRVSLEDPQKPFPRSQAHGIYKRLIGGIEDVISDKDHIFLVPSGALGSIPLGILVTETPEGIDSSPGALRNTHWWGTQQALTTLPSISSLKAIRSLSRDGRGREPFAGFGNPVLDGPNGENDKRSAQLASRGAGAYFKGKYGDLDAIRTMAPLPQTEIELFSLAKAMKANPQQSLWLGSKATETNLKSADLSQKRVLAFATHGLMSGEMSGLAEPALVLTPPEEATELDDGLLTASEAALLDLNADWVILSACNTAAADQPGADGLSGLARAFFYAGARSMLVSHWPVRDDAAARLTTTAIRMQDFDPTLGRAEALRRSMLVLMNDTVDPTLAHPSAWAPFVIVGEGGSDAETSLSPFDPLQYKP